MFPTPERMRLHVIELCEAFNVALIEAEGGKPEEAAAIPALRAVVCHPVARTLPSGAHR